MTRDELKEELFDYAGAKLGAEISYSRASLDLVERGTFLEFDDFSDVIAVRFPVLLERLAHWHTREKRVQAEKGNTRTEVLWLNQSCVERLGFGPLFNQEAA